MKALAIDMAVLNISFTAHNEGKESSITINTQRQSEMLIECMQTVMAQVDLQPSELEFTALTSGPGSFTGLRLAFAALKGLQMSYNCPIYAVPTLSAYAEPFLEWNGVVIPVIDAKKERFYASIFRGGKEIAGPFDLSCKEILRFIDQEESILIAGNDAPLFFEEVKKERPLQKAFFFETTHVHSQHVLKMAYKMKNQGIKPLEAYEGPTYIRKSEAEENLKNAN